MDKTLLLTKYDKNKFTFKKLKEYGIKTIRGPRNMPPSLSKEANK